MHVLRSLLFYAVFYGGTVYYVLGCVWAIAFAPAKLRQFPDNWSRFTVRETGARPTGPALYAFKHESFFEAIDLPNTLDFPVPFGKEELYRLPGWGKAAKAYGSVTVYRDQGAKALRSMIAEAKQFIGTGRPLVIFPEGSRVPHGTRPPLKSGFAAIYKLLGAQVVPVAVDSGPLYHRWWKRPGTITLHFGEPIAPGLPREEIEARVRAAINVLNS